MNEERRYSSSEIEWIFAQAAEQSESRSLARAGEQGLTLKQLHEIAGEVGLAPDLVTRAASALDRGLRDDGIQRTLGLPLRVARTVSLSRDLTEDEWERLVADARETFHASGRIRTQGRLREWSNGNLHLFIEPEGSGHRLRMETLKESAAVGLRIGAGALAMAVILALLSVLTGDPGILTGAVALLAVSVAAFGSRAVTLPSWASRRLEQMDGLAERLTGSLAALPPGEE